MVPGPNTPEPLLNLNSYMTTNELFIAMHCLDVSWYQYMNVLEGRVKYFSFRPLMLDLKVS